MLEMGYWDDRESVNKELSVLGVNDVNPAVRGYSRTLLIARKTPVHKCYKRCWKMRVRQLIKLLQKLVLTHQTQ